MIIKTKLSAGSLQIYKKRKGRRRYMEKYGQKRPAQINDPVCTRAEDQY